MNRLLRPALGALLALVLAGCEHVQTGANRAKVQAGAVVRVIYGQMPDSAVDSLGYASVDTPRAIKRIRDRFPQIRPFLERGVIGISSDGQVSVRDAAGLAQEERAALERLVRDENRDRLALYRALSSEAGHVDELDWMAYEGASFAAEWIGQAPAGWWYQDERRRWAQKPGASGTQ